MRTGKEVEGGREGETVRRECDLLHFKMYVAARQCEHNNTHVHVLMIMLNVAAISRPVGTRDTISQWLTMPQAAGRRATDLALTLRPEHGTSEKCPHIQPHRRYHTMPILKHSELNK